MSKWLYIVLLLTIFQARISYSAIISYDSFSVYNTSDLNTHTSDVGGTTWTRHPSYSGNAAFLNFGRVWGAKLYYASNTPGSADYAVEADVLIKTLANIVDVGVLARVDTAAFTCYMAKYNAATSQWQIVRYNSGAATAGGSYSQSLAAWTPYRLKMTVEHTDSATETIKLYVDGVLRVTYADTAAGRITATGKAGIWLNGTASNIQGSHLDNFILKDISSTPGIRLFDFDNKTIARRNGTSANVTIRGAYDGTPAGIEAHIVQHGTSTEVVTWTALSSATVANGFFSGTISVPQGGWYSVQVRHSDSTGTASNGSSKIGVGIIVGLTGQSNMSNWNVYSDVVANDLSARQTYLGKVDVVGNGMSTAANTIIAALGVPVMFLDYGVSGVSIDTWIDTVATSNYGKFKHGVNECGGVVDGIIWSQGEYEATNAVAEATYKGKLDTLVTQFRADTGVSKVYFSILPRAGSTSASDSQWQAIRNAQIKKISEDSNLHGSTNLDLPQGDIHYTSTAYTTNGLRLSKLLLYHNYAVGANPTGPALSCQIIDSTHLDIKLTHVSGTDFVPASAINNFIVNDNGSPVTISSAVRTNSTTIRLTLTSPTVGTVTVLHDYGKLASASNLVDNSAGAYPAQVLYGGIVPKLILGNPAALLMVQ